MKIVSTTLVLTVTEPQASSDFLVRHFGFVQKMAFDGGAAIAHGDGGPELFFLKQGIEVLAADQRNRTARGIIVAFTVPDLDREAARLRDEGVATPSVHDDEWGERSMQIADPNGVILQLVEWVGERPY